MKKVSYKGMKIKQRPIEINLAENGRNILNFESDCDELKHISHVDDIGNLTFEEWLCPDMCKLEDLKDFYFYKVIEKLGPSDIWSKKIREEKSIYMQLVNYAISFLFEGVSINEILQNLLSVSSSNNVYIDKLNKMGYVATLTLIQLEVTKTLLNAVSNSDNYMFTMSDSKQDFIYTYIQMISLLYLKKAKKCINVLKNKQLYHSYIMLEEEDMTYLFKNKDFKQYFLCLMERKVSFVSNILQKIGIKSLIDNLEKYDEGVYPFSDKEYENMKNTVDAQPNYEYFLSKSKNKKVVDLFSNVRVFDEFDKIDTSSKNLKAWERLAAGSSQLLQYYGNSNYEYKSEGCIEDLFSKMLRKYKDTYLISNYSEVFNDMDLIQVLSYLIISRSDIEMRLMTQMDEDIDSNYVSKLTTKNLYLALHVLIIDMAPDIIDTLPLMEWARKNDRKLYEDLLKNPCVNRNFSIAVKYNKKLSEAKSAVVVAFPYLQKSIVNDHAISDSLMERLSGYNIMYYVDCSIKSFLFKEMLWQVEDWLDIRITAYNIVMEKIYRYCRNTADKLENYVEIGKSDEQKIVEDITDTVVGYYIEEKKKEAEAKESIRRIIELEKQSLLQKVQIQIEEYGSIRELIENLKEGKVHPKSKIKSVEDILLTPIKVNNIKDEDGCIISFDTSLNLIQNVFYGVCMGNEESPDGTNKVEELMHLLCMFYFRFEEDEIDFPLAILINICRILLNGEKSKLNEVLSKMDTYVELSKYITDFLVVVYKNGYKVSKKKIKTVEDVKKFLCDEISAFKFHICRYGKGLSANYSISPELADEMYSLKFNEDVKLDLESGDSFIMAFPDFEIQTSLNSDEFECKITVNSKNRFIKLFTVKYNKDINKLLNSDVYIDNYSLLGLLSRVNNDIISWGKNGIMLNPGEVILNNLVNPGAIGSKIYNKFPEEVENYVRKIQEWTGETLAKNFIMSFLAEGVEKSQEYIKGFIRSMINVHLNTMYYKQSGFLVEENLENQERKELVLAPEYYKWKKINSKQFDSGRIDLEEFRYAPILKVTDNVVDILKFQVFLIKLGLYGSKYVKLPERFYKEEEQNHLEEVYNMLMKEGNEDVIIGEDVKSFLFDDVKFEFPLLKDKLKLTNSGKIDPENLRCYYLNRLGESLVLYDCEYDGEKITIKDEAYLDYIESFYFYFNNGRLNEYNIYSPVVEDMRKINEETMRIAELIREEQAITVYSYVVYAILILDRHRIIQLVENTRNRKFIGKIIPENEVDYEKVYSDDSKNKEEVESDAKENEEEKQAITIRRNSLNDEENRFLDTLSPEEFRLLEDVSDVNGVKVINLGNLFFKKMNRLMQGIRSLERVAPRYKIKSWAVRGYTRTSKNGVVSYIEGGVRRRNTELLDKDAIERQEKILSLDDVLKTTNIFEDK